MADLEAGPEAPLLCPYCRSAPAYGSTAMTTHRRRSTSSSPQRGQSSSIESHQPVNHVARTDQVEDGPTTAAAKGDASRAPKGEPSRWHIWKPSHSLVNKGSVARDHLALERTYLAWLRTSLTLSSIGIAITQLFRLAITGPNPMGSESPIPSPTSYNLQDISQLQALLSIYGERIAALEHPSSQYRYLAKPLGGTFIILSLVTLLLGTRRFFHVQSVMMQEPSMFPPSRRSVYFASISLSALIIASFVVILATK